MMENQTNELAIMNDMPNVTKSVKDILLQTIDKVKNDNSYCKQASTINNTVNNLIKVAKLELAYMKMVSDGTQPNEVK